MADPIPDRPDLRRRGHGRPQVLDRRRSVRVIPWALLPDATSMPSMSRPSRPCSSMLPPTATRSAPDLLRPPPIVRVPGLHRAHGTSGIVQCRRSTRAVSNDDFAAQHQISDPVALAGALQTSAETCAIDSTPGPQFRPSGLSFLRSLSTTSTAFPSSLPGPASTSPRRSESSAGSLTSVGPSSTSEPPSPPTGTRPTPRLR